MNTGRLFWGLALVAFGVLLLLDRMYLLDFSDILHTYWPLLIVLWGISILLRPRGHRVRTSRSASGAEPAPSSTASSSMANQLHSSSVFGDANLRVDSKEFRGGTVSTVFGDTEVDLRDAALADGEHLLKLHGVFGDAEIWLPRDAAFAVSSNTVFGDVRINEQKREGFSASLAYESPNFAAATKRLRIEASQVFGDVTIKS